MKLEVYSVHDKAVNAFMAPFYTRSRGEALRSFMEACTDAKSNFAKYPMDYTLVYLGYFDDNSGEFEATEPLRVLGAIEVASRDVSPPPEAS